MKGLRKVYYVPYMYPYQYPHYVTEPLYNHGRTSSYPSYPHQAGHADRFDSFRSSKGKAGMPLTDYGPNPFVVNINKAAKQNDTYRTALWTGNHLQVTLMSLNPGEDIGLEVHSDVDQFLRIEQGQGVVQMGKNKDHLNFRRRVQDDSAIIIPAGTWHNLMNTGNTPLKLYSIYAPPNHPAGTIHVTKAEAMAVEEDHE
ncbi:Mannose-6-phosphate isomerase [Bacillus thermotolerans]|uniref:Mannose-6-phosphate isomerase n=1 Tax=Bacillus thermotolerans TaxID=1221996 RepID=A0A0F5HSB6_BACTR|nr:Mannose-6-phosphate isomerase [Bacillus thermotolerans]KKB36143.1 Mannose-6-phosphate isomerase [Bacillus thermotolerans]